MSGDSISKITHLAFPSTPGTYDFTCNQAGDRLRIAMSNQEGGAVAYFLTGEQEGELREFLNRRFESLSP